MDDANTFRPRKTQEEPIGHTPFDPQMASGNTFMQENNVSIQGKNIPPEFLQEMQRTQNLQPPNMPQEMPQQTRMTNMAPNMQPLATSGHFSEILQTLKGFVSNYEPVTLPSLGRFYNGNDGPTNGIVHIRPMTGEEEQILASRRLTEKGEAMNMIFKNCLQEKYSYENLLSEDRTYLLIYLRGISYTPAYDCEIKCPECEKKFSHTIDLNELIVDECPENYGPVLTEVLPTTKLPFSYRLSNGRDEQDLMNYRDRKLKNSNNNSADDTLIYRTASLINNIDGVTSKMEIMVLLKNLPINDLSFMRNVTNDPPFGVNTSIDIICPHCGAESMVELPYGSSFFFPRQKRDKMQT